MSERFILKVCKSFRRFLDTIIAKIVAILGRFGGAHGVMVIGGGYGHGDTSSNPGRD